MVENDSLRAPVSELVETFRSSLIALIPFAERSMMSFADNDQHPSWERLAESCFDSFVRDPIKADLSTRDALPLARYDIDASDYRRLSWIAVTSAGSSPGAVVRLLTRSTLFDTIETVDLDPVTLRAGKRRELPWEGATFVFVRHAATGPLVVVTEILAVE